MSLIESAKNLFMQLSPRNSGDDSSFLAEIVTREEKQIVKQMQDEGILNPGFQEQSISDTITPDTPKKRD